MKTRNLLVWACLAIFVSLAPVKLQAQESRTEKKREKETVRIDKDSLKRAIKIETDSIKIIVKEHNDSLEKALRDLHDDLRKMQIEVQKKVDENLNDEKVQAELNKQLDGLDEKLDELDKTLEKMEKELEEEFSSNDTSKRKDKRIIITDDGIEINMGDKSKKIDKSEIKEKRKNRRLKNSKVQLLGLDLGVNALTNQGNFNLQKEAEPLDLNLPKSINLSLHLIRQGVNIYHHNVYATYGLTLDMHDYRLANKKISIDPKAEAFDTIHEPIEFKKSKLTAHYLTVPVMFHFESNPRRPNSSFKLGVGGYGGILVNSYTKQVSSERGKQHFYDDFNLNKINYGVRAQVGYGLITLYSQYALSPLFQENKGPNLNPITFGVVLNGFKWN